MRHSFRHPNFFSELQCALLGTKKLLASQQETHFIEWPTGLPRGHNDPSWPTLHLSTQALRVALWQVHFSAEPLGE